MNKPGYLNQACEGYVRSQGLGDHGVGHGKKRPTLALVRQWGTPMEEVETLLMAQLNASPKPGGDWVLFDDNLVRHVLREHNLPQLLERAMPEDRAPKADEFWREVITAEPSQWDLVQKTNDTLYRLAKRGGCVLVGRGAPWIAHDLPGVVRAAITGSPRHRADRLRHSKQITPEQARKEVAEHDHAAHRYLAAHFGRNVDDYGSFDLVVNSDHLSPVVIADLLYRVVMDRMGS